MTDESLDWSVTAEVATTSTTAPEVTSTAASSASPSSLARALEVEEDCTTLDLDALVLFDRFLHVFSCVELDEGKSKQGKLELKVIRDVT